MPKRLVGDDAPYQIDPLSIGPVPPVALDNFASASKITAMPRLHCVLLLVSALIPFAAPAAEPMPLALWPAAAPGETGTLPPEADTTRPGDQLVAGRSVIRLGNVSTPTLTLYRAAANRDTGAAVLVCPGGGYHILAMDLEGTEVCAWLNSIGVTAVLLKYRVPARVGQERYLAPLQDAQRALSVVRAHAGDWALDPRRIGVLGFSAGGHLAAALGSSRRRSYEPVDGFDAMQCRPDFVVLIYPAYLAEERQHDALRAEVAPAKGVTPPTFLAMAEDDPLAIEDSPNYYLALRRADVAAEMHLYPTGGHGYGLRRTADLVTTWPDRVAEWLAAGGWLRAAK